MLTHGAGGNHAIWFQQVPALAAAGYRMITWDCRGFGKSTFQTGIHGCDEITYLYVREPGGFRIELNAGGWVNAMPDWRATDWHPSQGGTTFWKNVAMPESMMECWPAVKGEAAQETATGFQSTQLCVGS